MAKEKNEVAKVEGAATGTALVTQEPSMDWMKDAGVGFEGADKDSYAVPFLRIIQKGSPQCDETKAEFDPAVRPGMIINTVTKKIVDPKVENVIFLPCAFSRTFLRWGPRGTDAGGFKGAVSVDAAAEMRERGEVKEMDGLLLFPNEKGELNPKKCDRLTDTRSHFGLVINADGSFSRVVISLSSTQIKKSKGLMALLSEAKIKTPQGLITPPTWMNRVKITSVAESNEEGNWQGIVFTPDGFLNDGAIYAAAKEFHDSIASGAARVDFESDAANEPASGSAAQGF